MNAYDFRYEFGRNIRLKSGITTNHLITQLDHSTNAIIPNIV